MENSLFPEYMHYIFIHAKLFFSILFLNVPTVNYTYAAHICTTQMWFSERIFLLSDNPFNILTYLIKLSQSLLFLLNMIRSSIHLDRSFCLPSTAHFAIYEQFLENIGPGEWHNPGEFRTTKYREPFLP